MRAAACASLTPWANRARDGVMGERAFAKSRKGEARSEACIDIIFFLREEGEEDGKRGETGGMRVESVSASCA